MTTNTERVMTDLTSSVKELKTEVTALKDTVHEHQLSTVQAVSELKTAIAVLEANRESPPFSMRPVNKLGMDAGQTRQLATILVTVLLSALGVTQAVTHQREPAPPPPPSPAAPAVQPIP